MSHNSQYFKKLTENTSLRPSTVRQSTYNAPAVYKRNAPVKANDINSKKRPRITNEVDDNDHDGFDMALISSSFDKDKYREILVKKEIERDEKEKRKQTQAQQRKFSKGVGSDEEDDENYKSDDLNGGKQMSRNDDIRSVSHPKDKHQKQEKHKFRDRARERRLGLSQGLNHDELLLARSLDDPRGGIFADIKNFDPESLKQISAEQSRFLGGDIEYTHLVKGLDYALLEKVRREEEKKFSARDTLENISLRETANETLLIEDNTPVNDKATHGQAQAILQAVQKHTDALVEQSKISFVNKKESWIRCYEYKHPIEMFLPERTKLIFNVTSREIFDAENLPIITKRSKADCPPVFKAIRVDVPPELKKKLENVMSYVRGSSSIKSKLKEAQTMNDEPGIQEDSFLAAFYEKYKKLIKVSEKVNKKAQDFGCLNWEELRLQGIDGVSLKEKQAQQSFPKVKKQRSKWYATKDMKVEENQSNINSKNLKYDSHENDDLKDSSSDDEDIFDDAAKVYAPTTKKGIVSAFGVNTISKNSIELDIAARRKVVTNEDQEFERFPETVGQYPEINGQYPKSGEHYYPETVRQYPETDGQYPETDRQYPETDRQYPETDRQYPETDEQYHNTDVQYQKAGGSKQVNRTEQTKSRRHLGSRNSILLRKSGDNLVTSRGIEETAAQDENHVKEISVAKKEQYGRDEHYGRKYVNHYRKGLKVVNEGQRNNENDRGESTSETLRHQNSLDSSHHISLSRGDHRYGQERTKDLRDDRDRSREQDHDDHGPRDYRRNRE